MARVKSKKRSGRKRAKHWALLTGYTAIVVGAVLFAILALAIPSPIARPQVYGVSFSAPHARGLGLDWQETYNALLNDLGVRHLRLSAYWNEIQVAPDQFDFSSLDYQLDQAAAHEAQVLLAVGRKLPRWPECHVPEWARQLPEDEQQARVLNMMEAVVIRYHDHPALAAWQLENEPFLAFGNCPPFDRDFLIHEEALLRELDPEHPILITDSGELNWWIAAAAYGDRVGTTMYRTVFSSRTEDLFHYDYLFPAWLYRAKARLVRITYGKPVIISELQGEPWGRAPFTELSVAERRASLSVARLQELQRFAVRTQLPLAYWWGAEYWYWEKVKQNEPAFWETARTFFHDRQP